MTSVAGRAAALVAGVPSLPWTRLLAGTAHEVDRLAVDPGVDLVWVRVPARVGSPVVVVTADGGDRAVSPADALVRLAARADRRWTTEAAAIVRWTGPVVQACGNHADPAGLAATATNDLRAVHVDGRPAVLKVYRVPGSDRGEGRVLAALGGGLTPRPLAQITYQPAAAAAARLLALVTERMPGRTLDELLRDSLHDAWCTGGRLDPRTRVALARVRSALARLHAALGLACGPGAAHGALHLAHVLLDRDRVSFVDVAEPDPHVSPADDGAALRRAVECLALDLLVARAAAARSRPAIDVVDELRTTAVVGAEARTVLGPLESVVPRELCATRVWTARVSALLDPGGSADVRHLPYLSRLVHDVAHHTRRGDRYHAGLAWCHLVQACSPVAARPPGSPSREEPP